MNDLEIAKNVVVNFIKEMNLWEKECNNIEKEVSLSYQEKTERKKELLVKLFNKFCTNKKRTYGRPNVIDYGTNGYYEYDPDKEVIEEVTEENKKIIVITYRESPLKTKYMYILLKKGEYWLIDSKKKCFLLDDKWKPIFLQMIYSQNLNFKIRDNTRQNMSTGILGWFFGKGPNKAFNKGVEKVANHHSHKSFGQLFEEATEESYVCKLKY